MDKKLQAEKQAEEEQCEEDSGDEDEAPPHLQTKQNIRTRVESASAVRIPRIHLWIIN